MIVLGIICSRVSYCIPFLLLYLSEFMNNHNESKHFRFVSLLGNYSLEIYLAQTITTNYMIAHLLNAWGILYVIVLTPIITVFFVILDNYAKKGLVKFGVYK